LISESFAKRKFPGQTPIGQRVRLGAGNRVTVQRVQNGENKSMKLDADSMAKEKGVKYEVAKFPWSASGRALSFDRTDGVTKMLIDPDTDRILGVGICGAGAGERTDRGRPGLGRRPPRDAPGRNFRPTTTFAVA